MSKKNEYTIDYSPKPKRDNRIFELKTKGLSLREIAKMYNISYERVRQICDLQAKKQTYAQDSQSSRLDTDKK